MSEFTNKKLNMHWGFETFDFKDNAFAMSHKSYGTIHEAALAAAEWLEINAENGVLAVVRIHPKDKPKECPYAKSKMTPCVRKDGEIARSDKGICVGCERKDVWA